MESVEKRIEKMVRSGGEGKVWFPSDFFECGSDKAVSKALQRLVDSDVLMRMERGIYCYPEVDRLWGMGKLPASYDQVLDAMIEKEGFRLGPSFGEAQNALGLSEQVVCNPVFTTDGPSREIKYRTGACPIVLQHVPFRVFGYKTRIMMMADIALSEIGKDDLWQFDLDGLQEAFSRVPYSEIREDLRRIPAWIRKLILKLYENNTRPN